MEKCNAVTVSSTDLGVDDLVNLAEEINHNKCELMLLLLLNSRKVPCVIHKVCRYEHGSCICIHG